MPFRKMKETGLKVHGSIYYLLRKFVISNYSVETWDLILKDSGLIGKVYDMTGSYPLSELDSIISVASALTGETDNKLKERFGEYMVPDLFVIYHSYLNPVWKTFDLIEQTELIMHGAVRSLNSSANPPVLHVTRVNNKLLIIDYYSKRRMSSLAIGIIKGIAIFYKESDFIEVNAVSNLDDERVQIKVSHH